MDLWIICFLFPETLTSRTDYLNPPLGNSYLLNTQKNVGVVERMVHRQDEVENIDVS